MCVNPIRMYCVGRNRKTGKAIYTAHPLVEWSTFIDVPCGTCFACLDSRRKEWARRLECETWLHDSSTYFTLTYNDEHLPHDRLVRKTDVQCFIKRLRHVERDYGLFFPRNFRYFVASEYGDHFGRPHYHGIAFGFDFCSSPWKYEFVTIDGDGYPVYTSRILERIWRNGFVSVDRVTPKSIRYVTSYILQPDDDNFSLFSRGLGRDWFVRNDKLLPSAFQAYNLGYLTLSDGHGGSYKSRVPRFLDRYVEKYDSDLYNRYRLRKQDFVAHLQTDNRPASERLFGIMQRRKQDNERKSLHGDPDR